MTEELRARTHGTAPPPCTRHLYTTDGVLLEDAADIVEGMTYVASAKKR